MSQSGACAAPAPVLGTACATHFVHDGFADILYVLFPVWAREFGLSFAQVGLLRTAYSGAMAAFQIPAGLLAERWGEARLLAAGTAATCSRLHRRRILRRLPGPPRLAARRRTRFGRPASAVVHLVSNAYDDGGRRTALGTYNFSGDLGKVAVPAAVAFAVPWLGWRGAVEGFAAIGLAAAVLVLLALTNLKIGHTPVPRDKILRSSGSDWGIRDLRGFQALSLIQVIDSSTRTGLLTFLPFLLIAKGSSVRAVGFALMLIFAGGAAGKFACGVLAERLGVIRTVIITETATGLGILLLLALPLTPALALLPRAGRRPQRHIVRALRHGGRPRG
jgi:predicted MFS family arabinose efflux permease